MWIRLSRCIMSSTPKGCKNTSQGEAAERRHPWFRTVQNPGTPLGCQDNREEN
jgi:hypothetical protein